MTWKWDMAHVVIILAYAVGLVWHVLNLTAGLGAGQTWTVQTVIPLVLVVAVSIVGFFKTPPQTPEQALQQGEGLAKKKEN